MKVKAAKGSVGAWRMVTARWEKGHVPFIPRDNLAVQHAWALLDAAETQQEWDRALGNAVHALLIGAIGPEASEAEQDMVSAIVARISAGHVGPPRRPRRGQQMRSDAMWIMHFGRHHAFGDVVRYLADIHGLTKEQAQKRVRRVEDATGLRFVRAPQGRRGSARQKAP